MSMVYFISYNLFLLLAVVILAPFWLIYLLVKPKARSGFWKKLAFHPRSIHKKLAQLPTNRKRIWFHAVSVGELNAIRPLIESYEATHNVIITTTTKTSQTLAKKLYLKPERHILVAYFPFDLIPAVVGTLSLLKPDILVIAETELWPNVIWIAKHYFKIPIIIINGRISNNSYKGYRNFKFFMSNVLKPVQHFYMQTQADASRIEDLGDLPVDKITVAGNLKFDINPDVDPIKVNELKRQLNIQDNDTVLVFASTHQGEDTLFLNVYQQLVKNFPELKVILAPRHPERRQEVSQIATKTATAFSLRSKLSDDKINTHPVVILDSIGELMMAYHLSSIAVMGGSFADKGGQNPLEPLSQKIPVVMGPNMDNFEQIKSLILEQEAGKQVASTEELGQALTEILTQPEIYHTLVENGVQLLENNRGARDTLYQGILSALNDTTEED